MVTGILNSALASAEQKAEPVTAVPPSLADVYEAEFNYVYRCLKGLGVPTAAIDDAVQDVFVVVQQKLRAFDGKNRLRTWLYAIALRVARRYREQAAKAAHRHVQEDAVPLQSRSIDAIDAVDALEQQQQLELAQRALQTLSSEKREVFVLNQIEQLSAPEIAELTDVPLNTVYSRLRAAKNEFQSAINRIQNQPRQPSQPTPRSS